MATLCRMHAKTSEASTLMISDSRGRILRMESFRRDYQKVVRASTKSNDFRFPAVARLPTMLWQLDRRYSHKSLGMTLFAPPADAESSPKTLTHFLFHQSKQPYSGKPYPPGPKKSAKVREQHITRNVPKMKPITSQITLPSGLILRRFLAVHQIDEHNS